MVFLIGLNVLLSALGNTGGPLMSRLYFRKGGKCEWLSAFLETAGFPILLIPMYLSYRNRRLTDPTACFFLSTPKVFLACVVLGILTCVDDYLYAYGLSFLPASTSALPSALLISTQLGLTAFFAFLMVRQRFTSFSLNAVALLTVGAVVLGLHASSDRPSRESNADYYKGFFSNAGLCGTLWANPAADRADIQEGEPGDNVLPRCRDAAHHGGFRNIVLCYWYDLRQGFSGTKHSSTIISIRYRDIG